MCKQRISAIQHMSNSIFLVRAKGNCRIHTLKCDMASIVFTGTGAVEPHIVFLHQIGTALRVFENPLLECGFNRILLLLCQHGFFLIEDTLLLSIFLNLIKNTGIPEIQRILQQFIAIYPVCTVGHAHTDISVTVPAFPTDVPFSR